MVLEGHPALTRILWRAAWPAHPLRKDGPLAAIRRYLAIQRSRQIWR